MASIEIFHKIFTTNSNTQTRTAPPIPPRPIPRQKSNININTNTTKQSPHFLHHPPSSLITPPTSFISPTQQNLSQWRNEFRRLIIKIYLSKPRRLSEINKIATRAFGGKKNWADVLMRGRRNGLYSCEELFIFEALVEIGVVGRVRMDGEDGLDGLERSERVEIGEYGEGEGEVIARGV